MRARNANPVTTTMRACSTIQRNNPSILLQSPSRFNVVFDVGKTFHASACAFFPQHGVQGVDCVVLTHEHADAILGLDDLRVCQRPLTKPGSASPLNLAAAVQDVIAETTRTTGHRVDEEPPLKKQLAAVHYWTQGNAECVVFASEQTSAYIARCFPYLVSGGAGGRFVSKLRVQTFKLALNADGDAFTVPHFFTPERGLRVVPLPVEHGPGFVSAGFLFGAVVYLSDIGALPERTRAFILSRNIEILIVDCLRPRHPPHAAAPVHFDLVMCLACIESLGPPPQTYITGIGHEMPHADTNAALKALPIERFGRVQLAFDGLALELPDLA